MTQHYIGAKQVIAWPQAHEDGRPGYAIRYPDGYQSWSPKATFEAAYLPMGEESDGSKVTEAMVDDFIIGYASTRMGNHTVLHVELANGFSLVVDSACVDAKNYDHEIGTRYAMAKAKTKVWELLGFLLATARRGVNVPYVMPERLLGGVDGEGSDTD